MVSLNTNDRDQRRRQRIDCGGFIDGERKITKVEFLAMSGDVKVVGQSASSKKKWQLVVGNLELVRKLRSRDGISCMYNTRR